jgi:DNA-binding transcriptional ArsR family regulator
MYFGQTEQMPDLVLDLPWVESVQKIEGLTLRRGSPSALRYDDGIELAVEIVDPAGFDNPDDVVASVHRTRGPGYVALVAGAVPLAWRSLLRRSNVSFVDPSGVAEISWPRLKVSSGQFARPSERTRAALPMQKSHAVTTQELLAASLRGERLTIGELADRAAVGLSSASRAVSQLQAHGLVEKRRDGRAVYVVVADPVPLAELLARRSAWPQGRTLSAFAWGRTIWDVAASVSDRASSAGLALSVTGRTALAYLGVLSTSPPDEVRCWVGAQESELEELAERLGLEPAPAKESNVVLAADPWGVGMIGRTDRTFEGSHAIVASPIRVWCDLHSERRGTEFAAQLWMEIERRG